ncbi:MAG: M3 family oligoendopeptidase [Gorillibacterium sp.]|nr:M3 family oligoendopeptidase [Gorillibacterium sp.]
MNLTWDLNALYPSFNSSKFKAERELLNHHIKTINEWAALNLQDRNEAASIIEEFLIRYNAYKSVYSCLYSYAELILSADGNNIEAMNILDDIDDAGSKVTDAFVNFNNWLASLSNLDDIINTSSYLSDHRFYLKGLVARSRFLLSEEVEVVISKLQTTGSKAWERLYMQGVSSALMDLEIAGEIKRFSLSELRALAYNKNPVLRKAAYEAERAAYTRLAEQSAACINGISGEALMIYELRGYSSPLEKVLTASRMDAETLEAMTSAIKESLPHFHRYFKRKAECLGYPAQLPFYDIFAPIDGETIPISFLDARDMIVSSFRTFSAELGDYAQKAFDNHWIDAEPRVGKGNYGLCVDIFPIKESRIMTTFNGSCMDIGVLAHEIGHAYHSACLADETMLNTDYPTPIAETASIFCETVVNNELLSYAPAGDALSILEKSISEAGYYLVDFYGRYLFECALYKRRQSGSLSTRELNELMLTCMAEAYGDSVDATTIHPYMWMNKVGYFLAGNEFLNFPYSFGLLFSKGLYAQYRKKGQAFVAQYHTFLSATSKNNIVDAARIMNIDVHSTQFWQDAVQLIKEEIDSFIRSS